MKKNRPDKGNTLNYLNILVLVLSVYVLMALMIDIFFKLAPEWMASGGRILLEIEAAHGLAVLSLAYDTFSSAAIHLHKDLSGHDRLLEIQLPNQ